MFVIVQWPRSLSPKKSALQSDIQLSKIYILQYLTIVQQCLPFLYRQKLSELDEITRRLKKKLHVVTNEGFTAPSVHLIHENENSFRSEAASHTVSNTKDGKCTETVSVSSVNEEVYEGKLVLKITNLSQVAVGCLMLSVNKNDTERSRVKVAEQNCEVPVHFCEGCENVACKITTTTWVTTQLQ